jgi:polyhydroxyalkanoate synthesis regulator phasin
MDTELPTVTDFERLEEMISALEQRIDDLEQRLTALEDQP